jgi:hypothetical protein
LAVTSFWFNFPEVWAAGIASLKTEKRYFIFDLTPDSLFAL